MKIPILSNYYANPYITNQPTFFNIYSKFFSAISLTVQFRRFRFSIKGTNHGRPVTPNPDKLEFFKGPGLFSGTPQRDISTFTKIFSKLVNKK